jgi:hypothetical protein
VHVASILELLNAPQPATRSAANSQPSSPQTFIESLLASSKAFSDSESAQDQISLPEDAKETEAASPAGVALPSAPRQQPVSQPISATQQTPLQTITLNTLPSLTQLLAGEFVASPHSAKVEPPQSKRDTATMKSPSTESGATQPAVAKSDTVQLDALQATPILPTPEISTVTMLPAVTPQAVDHSAHTVANTINETLQSAIPHLTSQSTPPALNRVMGAIPGDGNQAVQSFDTRTAESKVLSTPQSARPNKGQSPVSDSLPSPVQSLAASFLPGTTNVALPNPTPVAVQTATPNAISATPEAAPANVAQPATQNTSSSAVPASLPSITPVAFNIALPTTLPNVVKTPTATSIPNAVSTPVAATKPDPSADAASAHHSTSETAPPAIVSAPQHAEPVPVPQAVKNTSPKGDAAAASNPNPADPAHPSVPTPDPTVPTAIANQVPTLIQTASAVPASPHTTLATTAVAKPASISATTTKSGPTSTISDLTDPAQHAQAASNQTGSQETASSDDQTQAGASQQGQSVTPAQMSFTNHTAAATIDHAQSTGIATASQPAATLTSGSHPAKTPDSATPVPAPLPQAAPAINTAKLIQSMGQSEMRVGMRSNEFGNISINTSATRDLISAQISLDHGELAKTLATHLPEIQARLGGSQAVDVRIDMNGQATGQNAGTSAGTPDGSAGQSRSGGQQRGGGGPGNSANDLAEQSRAASMPVPESRLDTRLDIRA